MEEISERIDALTAEQIRRLRDYEGAKQNRKTLMERFESRLRVSSQREQRGHGLRRDRGIRSLSRPPPPEERAGEDHGQEP